MQKPQQKKLLQEFIHQFTTQQLYENLTILSHSYYEIPRLLAPLIMTANDSFFCAGTFLGKAERGKFIPSILLLKKIAEAGGPAAIITDESAWLFCCGRDVLKKSILSLINSPEDPQSSALLVMNKQREVLGWGYHDENGIKNKWDIGDFLRRER